MANNYVQMSETYTLTDPQVAWVGKFLDDCHRFAAPVEPDDPEDVRITQRLTEVFEGLYEEIENLVFDASCQLSLSQKNKTLWITGDEYVNVDMVMAVLQTMLRETGDTRVCTGTWAGTCSKPRVGEFGGGWFAVSATEIRSGGTWGAAQDAAKEMAGK